MSTGHIKHSLIALALAVSAGGILLS
jgi:hypothetical protein